MCAQHCGLLTCGVGWVQVQGMLTVFLGLCVLTGTAWLVCCGVCVCVDVLLLLLLL
jgi:hypothetical protein